MGAFRALYSAERRENLQAALREYLGVGFEAGILHVT
jgi:hypothetical protein